MRFLTFAKKGESRLGLMGPDDMVIDLAEVNRRYMRGGSAPYLATMQAFIEAGAKALSVAKKAERYVANKDSDELKKLSRAGALLKLGQVKFLAPIPWPRKNVIMLGINYREHVEEGARARAFELKYPDAPVYFTKPATSVIGHMGKVIHHKATEKLDYEAEFALVIGKKGRDIPKEKVYDYIFGYTICLDMTARDLQRRHGQWFKGKALDTFGPLGPWIVTSDEVGDADNLAIQSRVNGQVRQNSNTNDMIFDVATLVSSISEGFTLLPGDMIATGTPEGVGLFKDPPGVMKPGDVVECEIEKIGVLRNHIVAPEAP